MAQTNINEKMVVDVKKVIEDLDSRLDYYHDEKIKVKDNMARYVECMARVTELQHIKTELLSIISKYEK